MVPAMNMEQVQQRQQRHVSDNLSPNFHHVESAQQTHRIYSFDGLPRTPYDQQNFVTQAPTSSFEQLVSNSSIHSHTLSSNYGLANPMTYSHSPTGWTGPTTALQNFTTNPGDYCNCPTSMTGNEQDHTYIPDLACGAVPRSWTLPYDPRMLNDSTMGFELCDAPAYMVYPNKLELQNSPRLRSDLADNVHVSSRDFARLSISHGPEFEEPALSKDFSVDKPAAFGVPSSPASDDCINSSREMTAMDLDDHGTDSDEPYAKLIYRALMSAPNHSMVLQEIYSWFRENTIKGSSDSKGWMNSIRHNLSMNAAFKKTERKISGDDRKKSTEWVLEDFAIRDGVQSTTRYRKGTGNKKIVKSENPAPGRQSSGRKGGLCAGKNKSQRYKFKEERLDHRCLLQKIDSGWRSHLHQTQPHAERQCSPPTPTAESASSPYFIHKVEQQDGSYEDIYGLESVQGVWIDDGPVFTNNQDSHFNSRPICANQLY